MKALSLANWPSKRKRLTRPGAALVALLIAMPPIAAQNAPSGFSPPPFKVADGFEVTIAAAPPLVGYPMMACFDDEGRLYVAESDGRNLTTRKEIEKELPRFVRRLVDTDGDGVFDESTIFADKMTMPEGGLWHDGALYLISAPYLWRLEDTDGDGVADKRQKVLGEMEFDGRANQHGPYLGPNGRLYFTGGHFGYTFTGTDGSKTGTSRAGGVFSCRPDGSDVRIDGQGPINPVEVIFTPEGELLSTAAIYDSFGGKRHDALIHWLPGGLTQRIYGVPLLPETGVRMPALIRWGQVAPAGLVRYRGQQFGPEYKDRLFTCHFNTNRVLAVSLKEHGATFTTSEEEILSSPNIDFRPADILEDADGSLLLIDTGGWLSWGCPHSKTSKPEIKGAIYRIRKKGTAPMKNPRGAEIAWKELSLPALAKLLADPRPAVQDRAQATLIKHGAKATSAVRVVFITSKNIELSLRCIFTLSQLDSDPARTSVRSALLSDNPRLRQAASRSVGEYRDKQAVPALIRILEKDKSPAVIRAAASALGQIKDASALGPLLAALKPNSEPYLKHAITQALLALGTVPPLSIAKAPHHQEALLRVLSQNAPKTLSAKEVAAFLTSSSPSLREEARRVITARPDWKLQVFQVFLSLLQRANLDEEGSHLLETIVLTYANDADLHKLIGQTLEDRSKSGALKTRLLITLGQLKTLPEILHKPLGILLGGIKKDPREEALNLALRFQVESLAGQISAIAQDHDAPLSLRLGALEAVAQRTQELLREDLILLDAVIRDRRNSPLLARKAARALSHLGVTEDNTPTLLRALMTASPLVIDSLIAPFARVEKPSTALQAAFGEALAKSPGRTALPPQTVAALQKVYPKLPKLRAGSGDEEAREAHLAKLFKSTAGGNASLGRTLFYSHKSTCTLCHQAHGQGGSLGPDLSKIGRIRSRKDLLEAILYPSATVVNGFENYVLEGDDKSIHAGLIQRETPQAIYLRGVDLRITRVPRHQIKDMTRSPVSLMPGGFDNILTTKELADLLAFLETCK